MAKISALTLLGATPADDDEFVILDVSDTTQGADGSTKALAASRVARTGAANTFINTQTIALSTNINGQNIDMAAANTAAAINVTVGSVAAGQWQARPSASLLFLSERDLGNNVSGSFFEARRNTNLAVGTLGPAAGGLSTMQADGTRRFIWHDNSGNLRTHTALPTGSTGLPTTSDTAGTVVGMQTSWHGAKENIEVWDGAEAFDAIRALTLYSYQMISDGQLTPSGDKPTYKGVVITDEDRANNSWFGLGYGDQQIPGLNERNLFGYMLAAIRHGGNIISELQSQVTALTARVEALEGAE